MKDFFDKAVAQENPIAALTDFLEAEDSKENAKSFDDWRFVGYALDIGYSSITIITCDPFKVAVGGVPRNSLLVMVPANHKDFPPHFSLLRVLDTAPTPLSSEVQQTYFELQKKSMPELDVFTKSELQWGALKAEVLGMFYPNPDQMDAIEFSGDVNNFVSAHKYKIYSPSDELLELICNSLVPTIGKFSIGKLRQTECRLPIPKKNLPNVAVDVSTLDFLGTRTAMFGKTRLGKSNIVKLVAESILKLSIAGKTLDKLASTESARHAGQLIFDINGEYANDNPQDGNRSLRSGYPADCEVYALTAKPDTPSKPLKLNFYEQSDRAIQVLASLLEQDGKGAIYVEAFCSTELPSAEDLASMPEDGEKIRAYRRILAYWAVLKRADFPANEAKMKTLLRAGRNSGFNPGFSDALRDKIHRGNAPRAPQTLEELETEFVALARFSRANPNDPDLVTGAKKKPQSKNKPASGELTVEANNLSQGPSIPTPDDPRIEEEIEPTTAGKKLIDPDLESILGFLLPKSGAGPLMIQKYRMYHASDAANFINDILALLDQSKTVILDLGNANERVMRYFSDDLSRAVFNHQNVKFTTNSLGNHYIQLYFEEAHNLFPKQDDGTSIYSRFAKEGAKYHIGIVYSTQSPSTVYKDLLAQTENFFVTHLSSLDEVSALARLNVAYESTKHDLIASKTPGYVRMLTRSNRFVIPVQARKFEVPATKEA